MKITLLGGCGAVGSVAAATLVKSNLFDEIFIADWDEERGIKVVEGLKSDKVKFCQFDANSCESLRDFIKGSRVVLNAIGPFYRYGANILRTVLEEGISYVDVCDDFDATEKELELNPLAREKNVTALIGMGSSPGLANVLVKFTAQYLLDRVDVVDIYHAHGGEAYEGPAVVKHRIHSMSIDIPVFLDGEFKKVKLFEESGRALEEVSEFKGVGEFSVYAYPHPETITLPGYLKGVKRVTNLGLVLPPAYAELIKGMVRLGITGEQPIELINGMSLAPIDFAVSFILHERERLVNEFGLTEPVGCLKIVVKGVKDGGNEEYIFSLTSKGKGMGEGTGIPLALGGILMATDKIKEKGVLPPEGCVEPLDILKLLPEALGAGKGMPLYLEHIDRNGVKEEMDPLRILSRFGLM